MKNAQKIGLFDNYTSTQDLSFVDGDKMNEWSEKYLDYHILPHFPKDKNARILEIGCGWGKYINHLTKKGYKPSGIDISKEQVEYAQKKFGLTNVTQADGIEFLTNTKETYDVIYMIDVLEHLDLEDSIKIGKLIYSKLNEGGIFLFQVPNGMSFLTPILYSDITHTRAFSDYMCLQYMKLSGFTSVSNFPLAPMPHGLKSKTRAYLWKFVINPLIKAYMLIANGTTMGGIYTSNILSVAKK